MDSIPSRKSLASQAADHIRGEILAGRMPQGSQLVTARLAGTLGVSRGPVREAIKMLRSEGLVVEEPHRGAFVVRLSLADVADIYEVRAAVEERAARLLARSGRVADRMRLEAIVDELESLAARERHSEMYQLDLDFHSALVEATGSPRLLEVMQRNVPLLSGLVGFDGYAYESLREVAIEHQPILDAIADRDEATAADLVQRHVEEAGRHVCACLASRGAVRFATDAVGATRPAATGRVGSAPDAFPVVEVA